MNSIRLVLTSAVLSAAMLSACDRAKEPEKSITTAPAAAPLPTPQMSTTATKASSKDSLPPIQGQVDTKEPAQRRDFETKR